MFAVERLSQANRRKLSFEQQGKLMGQKLGGTLIIVGGFLMLLGIALLPAALGQHSDEAIMGAGICSFALGTLLCAIGVYLKASALKGPGIPAAPAKPQKVKGGCDLCGTDTPAIHCRVHQLHLCANCLGKHYDFRSCVYVPSTRRSSSSKLAASAKA